MTWIGHCLLFCLLYISLWRKPRSWGNDKFSRMMEGDRRTSRCEVLGSWFICTDSLWPRSGKWWCMISAATLQAIMYYLHLVSPENRLFPADLFIKFHFSRTPRDGHIMHNHNFTIFSKSLSFPPTSCSPSSQAILSFPNKEVPIQQAKISKDSKGLKKWWLQKVHYYQSLVAAWLCVSVRQIARFLSIFSTQRLT